MSFRRPVGPADRAQSERLLDAARAGQPPRPGADPLAYLLAAAVAPASPGELPGEEQALAAFRAARANPASAPVRAPRRRRLRVGATAWVAGLAATATAGVAFAAVGLDHSEPPAPPSTPSTAGSTGAGGTGSPSGQDGSPTTGPGSSPSAGPGGSSTGGPGRPAGVEQLTGLCRAYLTKPAGQRPRALASPAFADLVAAAGGADRVDAYCARLVPEPDPKATPSVQPTRSARATTAPTPAAPTGKATAAPVR